MRCDLAGHRDRQELQDQLDGDQTTSERELDSSKGEVKDSGK